METIKKVDNYEIKRIYDDFGNEIRTLYTGSSHQSITYTNEKKFELYDKHTLLFDICANDDDDQKVLVLGGGCFSYPKYYISHYKTKTMDVVEIDKKMIDIAREFFYLDELYEKYDKFKQRLKIYCEDAFLFINKQNKKYDSIFIDLFIDKMPIKEVYEDNNLKKIQDLINNNGIIVINYIIDNNEESKTTYKTNINQLKKYFEFVNIYAIPEYKERRYGNVLIICSKNKKKYMFKTPIVELV